jgi:acetyl esterase/lipase
LAKKGIGCVIVNYRLSPQVKHPVHINDIAKAFFWIDNNIKNYDGDPNRIYIMGHSAGAQLAALLATNDQYLLDTNTSKTKIKGVIAISGIYDFNILSLKFSGLDYIFPTEKDRAEASPIRHIKHDTPSFLIFYAQNDYTTLDIQAKDMHAALRKAGCVSFLYMIPDKNHITILFDICDCESQASKNVINYVK